MKFLRKITSIIVTVFCLIGLLISCVSKKKFDETVLAANQQSQVYESQITALDHTILQKNAAIDSLRFLYAEQKGANEVLLITQDKLQDRIDGIQNQLLAEQKSKTSTAQDLRSVVLDKETTINELESKIAGVQGIIDKQSTAQNTMMGDFATELEVYGTENLSIKIINGELRISLLDNLFFRPGQSRIKTEGIANLKLMASLINKYPSIKVNVIGNTNNSKPRRFTDNLELSVLRAANIVRVLTDEYGVSPSRVLAGGKGEFAPVASNETAEGKSQNQRIDFIITTRMDRVVRDIDKLLIEKGE